MVEVLVVKDHHLHSHPGHPENPKRVEWILEWLERWEVWGEADGSIVTRVHSKRYVELVKSYVGWLDPDTYVTPHTYTVATRAATAAYHAPESSFVLTRPPGHHATRSRGMGFCIFNNAVFAALRDEKVGILDVDAHHGNGTQELLPENAVYASIHMGAGYPGTGKESTHRALNKPIRFPLTDDVFLRFVDRALDFFQRAGVEFLVLSLGFDGLREDPLSYFALTPQAFYHLGRKVAGWSWKAVLEGGYSRRMGEAARLFLEGLENP